MSNSKLSPKAQDDFALVNAAIEGNEKAYTLLMSRYRHSVYHAMFKMVNNRDDADDLTIEAFGKAFRKLPSYAPNYAFSTWLFKIAINNCIDHIRKKRLQTLSIDDPIDAYSDHDFSHNIQSHAPNPEETMIQEQKSAMIRKLIEKLNVKYRMMIELRYFEELSYEEIATELNIPLGTVKAQLFRAKEILHTQLLTDAAKAFTDVKSKKDTEEEIV
ncbi:MAG: polymerase sigma-24 factor [Bacteroidota bacterium]|jgi:RNA polymerase sigma factor (sigma-70 family)